MISVQMDVKQLNRWLSDIENKQIPFATSKALNVTAVQARNVAQRVMKGVFDKPTPFVIRGLRARMSTKKDLRAFVGYRLWAGKSKQDGRAMIAPHVSGGDRGSKRVETHLRNRGIIASDEYVTYSKYAKKDRYGNINRGTMQKMLSDMGAQFDSKQNSNSSTRAKFFIGTFGQAKQKMIVQRKRQRGGVGFVPFLIIIKKPHYKKRFDLQKIVDHTVAKHYSKNFKKAFTDAMRTAR